MSGKETEDCYSLELEQTRIVIRDAKACVRCYSNDFVLEMQVVNWCWPM